MGVVFFTYDTLPWARPRSDESIARAQGQARRTAQIAAHNIRLSLEYSGASVFTNACACR